MRILLCSPHPLDRKRGAPKVWIEFADAARALGHDVTLISSDAEFRAQRGNFDVIEVDHEHLPIARERLPESTLVVARSVLLVQHLDRIKLPRALGLRGLIGRALRAGALKKRIARSDQILQQVDLINVSNDDDRVELIRRGFDAGKIIVQPFGLSAARRAALESVCLDPPAQPAIALVGTFDYRKGALDLPRVFERISRVIPSARLHLLGTAGLFRTAADVLKFFPRNSHSRIQVVPTFEPDELPALLAGCSVGVFPSYCEGFGFGVLEMLAAGLPVVAYDAPGPPMMLPRDRLARAGDIESLAEKIIALLRSDHLRDQRIAARESSRRFDWREIARETIQLYQSRVHR